MEPDGCSLIGSWQRPGHERSSCPACCSFSDSTGAALRWTNHGWNQKVRLGPNERSIPSDTQSILLLVLPFSQFTLASNEGKMTQTRRDFLTASALGALSVALPFDAQSAAQTPAVPANQQTPGAPTAFGTAAPVGPQVTAATFAEAEKLVQIEMSAADRAQAAGNWREAMAPLYERRTGPRKMVLEDRACTGDGVESHAAGTHAGQVGPR